MPESTEVVLAIQLPALVEKLDPMEAEKPADALARLGLPRHAIETIESASGVGLENVEQLVIGVGFAKGSFPPQVVIVVRTRQPYDLAGLVRNSRARTLKKDGRTLHAAKATPLPEVYWWGPNNRELVATFFARDFAGVPQQAVPGTGRLSPGLADLIRERVVDDSSVWFVAASDRWGEYLRPYTFPWGDRLHSLNVIPWTPLEGRNDLLDPAERLRSVTFSVSQSPDRPVDLQIECKSAGGGEILRTALADRFHGEPIEVGGEGEICRVRTPFEPARVGDLIGRLIGPAR